jgi:protein TonB
MPLAASNQHTSDKTPAAKGPAKASGSTAPTAKSSSDAKPDLQESTAQPIVVSNGTSSPARSSTAASDVAAPSALEIAPSTSGGSLSNLLGNPSDTSKPVLQTLNVSQGVSQGLLIKRVQPTYPAAAMRMHVEGSVQLLATIGKTGNITAVKILSGEPLLAKAALDAVRQWKYKPYYLNGDPVEIQTQVTVNFKLPK